MYTYNSISIPDSFNTNILHQLFKYKIAFVNSQHEKTNLKGDFVIKNRFKRFVLRFMVYKDKSDSD